MRPVDGIRKLAIEHLRLRSQPLCRRQVTPHIRRSGRARRPEAVRSYVSLLCVPHRHFGDVILVVS